MEFWTAVALGLLPPPQPTRIRTVSRCATSGRDILSYNTGRLGINTSPLDVLVDEGAPHDNLLFAKRWRTQGVFPAHSFYRAADDILVCSPELCFARFASQLSTADLLLFGFELCGNYALSPSTESGFIKRPPVTNAARLLRFADEFQGRKGTKRMRQVAKAVLDGAESPMESILAAQLCCPTCLGGFGLEQASLNREIHVAVSGPLGRKTITRRCDMLWKDQLLAVEYDSSAHHSGAENIDRDARRRNQLLGENLAVVTVTKQQVYSFDRMEELAQLLAKLLGTRLRIRVKDFDERRMLLRKSLFKPSDQLIRPIIPRFSLPLW